MMLSDAISAARTEHEVYFLLTSYFDALEHSVPSGSLPDALLGLPLGGRPDLERRAAALGHHLDDELRPRQGGSRRSVIGEAFSVVVTALLALDRIDAQQREGLDEARRARELPPWPILPPPRGAKPESVR